MDEAKQSDIPPGTPEAVCLYADYRPDEVRTLIYLCNGTKQPLIEGILRMDETTLFEFVTDQDEGDINFGGATEVQLPSINPGQRMLVNELSHDVWDLVYRYELTLNRMVHRQETLVAYDRAVNASRLAEDPTAPWVVFHKR